MREATLTGSLLPVGRSPEPGRRGIGFHDNGLHPNGAEISQPLPRFGHRQCPDQLCHWPRITNRPHNGAVDGYQLTAVCPTCGSAAEVHAIQELAALARMQLGEMAPPMFPGQMPGAVPGYMQQPTTGPIPEPPRFGSRGMSRRMQRAAERVQPVLAPKGQELLRTQIAIADKYPELRACLSDAVIFLAGGSRVLPMPDLSALTMQQADNLVAALRAG